MNLQMAIADAMPIVAAFLSAWLTRGRSARPPSPERPKKAKPANPPHDD